MGSAFTSYFIQYIADDMQRGMASRIRREIRLKDDFFYNKVAECHNSGYKLKVEEDKAATAVPGLRRWRVTEGWSRNAETTSREPLFGKDHSLLLRTEKTLRSLLQNGCQKHPRKEDTWLK